MFDESDQKKFFYLTLERFLAFLYEWRLSFLKNFISFFVLKRKILT